MAMASPEAYTLSLHDALPISHLYSDRLIRPGDPAFFDILHSHLGYRTCYYRTFAVGSASRAQRDAYVRDRKSTRLNSSHLGISYAVFCLKKKKTPQKYATRTY